MTTAGGLAWQTANGNMTNWKSGWPRFPPSQCPRSRWKVTPTVRRIPQARRIAISSRASMSTALSPAASDTICRRKLRKPSPRRSSTSTASDLFWHARTLPNCQGQDTRGVWYRRSFVVLLVKWNSQKRIPLLHGKCFAFGDSNEFEQAHHGSYEECQPTQHLPDQ